MATRNRPLIGISVGDPAGIGPEVTAKALAVPEIYEICRPLAIAEAEIMKAAVQFSGLDLKIHPVSFPKAGRYERGTLDVLDLRNIDAQAFKYQVVSAEDDIESVVRCILAILMRPDQQDYEGTDVTVQIARKLDAPCMRLVVNKVPAVFDAACVVIQKSPVVGT